MTDEQIKFAIQRQFDNMFKNFGGDELLEGALDGEETFYDRACKLLEGATIKVIFKED